MGFLKLIKVQEPVIKIQIDLRFQAFLRDRVKERVDGRFATSNNEIDLVDQATNFKAQACRLLKFEVTQAFSE